MNIHAQRSLQSSSCNPGRKDFLISKRNRKNSRASDDIDAASSVQGLQNLNL